MTLNLFNRGCTTANRQNNAELKGIYAERVKIFSAIEALGQQISASYVYKFEYGTETKTTYCSTIVLSTAWV